MGYFLILFVTVKCDCRHKTEDNGRQIFEQAFRNAFNYIMVTTLVIMVLVYPDSNISNIGFKGISDKHCLKFDLITKLNL